MNILGFHRLTQAVDYLTRRNKPTGAILMYHRVANGADPDPWGLRVSPCHFAEHLEVLRQESSVMQLPELIQACGEGTLPSRAVAITFDDGYVDNLHHVKPLLKRSGIPATFFLTSGYIGVQREFWWDELERLILQADKLPDTLQLTFDGRMYQWTPEDDDLQSRYGHAWKEQSPGARHMLYYELYELLIGRPCSEQQQILNEIDRVVDGPSIRSTYLPLSTEEARALTRGQLVTIGAHTVTHPALPALSAENQRSEIRKSKSQLEQILEQPVAGFAYPHGRYADSTIPIVQNSGFSYACTTAPGNLHRHIDRFRLPRLQVLDWDGETFAEQLSSWL